MLTNIFKCKSFVEICDVQLNQCPWANLAHLQYEALLASIVPMCEIFLQSINLSINKCYQESVERRTDKRSDIPENYSHPLHAERTDDR